MKNRGHRVPLWGSSLLSPVIVCCIGQSQVDIARIASPVTNLVLPTLTPRRDELSPTADDIDEIGLRADGDEC